MGALLFNCKRTGKGALACVDAQMVVEVMELTEVLVATFVVAFENF